MSEPKAKKNSRNMVLGLLGITMLIILMWGQSGVAQGLADSLYCSLTASPFNCQASYCTTSANVASPANCGDQYCLIPTLVALFGQNCPLGTIRYTFGVRNTPFTTTSTTFVTIQATGSWNGGASIAPNPTNYQCIASFNFQANLLTGNEQFRLFDTQTNFSPTYQHDNSADAAINTLGFGVIAFDEPAGTSGTTINLQGKVSSNLITLTVAAADISCFSTNELG